MRTFSIPSECRYQDLCERIDRLESAIENLFARRHREAPFPNTSARRAIESKIRGKIALLRDLRDERASGAWAD